MFKVVLDSNAVLAFLNKEKNSRKIGEILKDCAENGVELIMSAVNFGEVYYATLRSAGGQKADMLYGLLSAIPVKILPVDADAVKSAGVYKAFKKMSYADCFAAALAKTEGAVLVTGDPEFKEVERGKDYMGVRKKHGITKGKNG